MTKIKTFEFMVNDLHGSSINVSDIDNDINNFISDKHIIDIKVDNYTANRHNNGYQDTVIAKYTIIYTEEK